MCGKKLEQRIEGEGLVGNSDEAIIRVSHVAMAHAFHKMKMGTCNQVPIFITDWCRLSDSN